MALLCYFLTILKALYESFFILSKDCSDRVAVESSSVWNLTQLYGKEAHRETTWMEYAVAVNVWPVMAL